MLEFVVSVSCFVVGLVAGWYFHRRFSVKAAAVVATAEKAVDELKKV
jgi:hypothetical protein